MSKHEFKVSPFQALEIHPDQKDLIAALLARYAAYMDTDIVEWEASSIIKDFLEEHPLDMLTVDVVAQLVLTTKFDPEYHLWN